MDEATDKITANQSDDLVNATEYEETFIAVMPVAETEDPEQLRAQIEDTRAEMTQTINEIQERLSPENVMDQVKEKVREATVGKVERVMNRVGETIGEVTEPAREVVDRAGAAVMQTGRSAADVVRKNPIPVALIGLGIGMLAMRAWRKDDGYDYGDMRRSRSPLNQQNLTGSEMQYGRGQSQYASTGTGSLNRVKETASDLAQRSTEALNNLGSKAKETATSVGSRFGQVLRDNPLAAGAVAVAAGTAVGLIIPTTRFENEYIGETSEMLVDKAQEVARDAIDKVQSTAQQMMPDQQQQQPQQQQQQREH